MQIVESSGEFSGLARKFLRRVKRVGSDSPAPGWTRTLQAKFKKENNYLRKIKNSVKIHISGDRGKPRFWRKNYLKAENV